MSTRQRSSSGQLPWWFGVPFALGGLVVLAFGFVLLLDELRFGSEGISVSGTVMDTVYYPGGGEDGPSFQIRYSFPVGGRLALGQSDVDESTFDATNVGDAIEVTYIPADPSKNRVGSPDPQLLVPVAVLGGGALFTIVGVGLLVLTSRIRRNGAPAWLTITSAAVEAEHDDDSDATAAANVLARLMADGSDQQPASSPGPATSPSQADGNLTPQELSALDARLAPRAEPTTGDPADPTTPT